MFHDDKMNNTGQLKHYIMQCQGTAGPELGNTKPPSPERSVRVVSFPLCSFLSVILTYSPCCFFVSLEKITPPKPHKWDVSNVQSKFGRKDNICHVPRGGNVSNYGMNLDFPTFYIFSLT